MKLSDEMPVTMTLKTWIILASGLITVLVYLVTLKIGYETNVDRLDNVRNRVWCLEHPTDEWTLEYKRKHRHDDE